jgi:tryptophan-rich sensory protein
MASDDAVRSGALVAGSIAQVVAPYLGSLAGLPSIDQVSREHPALITPPGPFFAVWGPIFAACGVAAVRQALPAHRDDAAARRTGWWLATAYAGNAAWEILSVAGPYAATPVLLAAGIVAPTARAHNRLQSLEEAPGPVVLATGLLLGWTSVATVVNVASALRLDGGGRRSVAASAAALAGTGVAMREVVRRSRRGGLAVAATSAWGLAGAAAGARSSTLARAAGVAAVALVADGARQVLARRR